MKLTPREWQDRFQAGTAHQVLFNGKDVTLDCVFADDEEHVVHLLDKDPEGGIRASADGEPLLLEFTGGTVEIRSMPRREWEKAFAVQA